ncbi:phosphatidylserine decarboxylase [Mucilaginibacter pineti]|uniref:Phosphatidylserine decarboxylase proenzyme n=1 Tax=Mucilaginibacter pineti TaxID=1391627 RepID=A0A1G7FMZ8_9SPHI|nr:phosphatidylserine decarboxylase [Mucilaginibacter pineti]
MTFHKEGYTSLAITILFIAVLNAVIQFYMPEAHVLKWIIYILSGFFFLVIVQFFRSPFFDISTDETTVLCPADGKVVVIEETDETEFLKDRRIQLSVFMSPVNVHVNRNPIAGVVSYFKYHKGKYLVAWHPKSSTENERTTIVIQNSEGVSVLFRQIAGALARRIVWYVKEGDIVEQGQQFGFIKFGSRVDVFLPLGTKILVNIGDVVKGGRTILAELPSALKAVAKAEKHKPAVTVESIAAPIAEPVADEEPTVITNADHQQELPLVIDHPKTETPQKPVKKAAAAKPAAPKSPKGKKE